MSDKIKLTFLGTAGAIPSAKKNHSAILLNYKDENILVDCGEGTQRQFRKAKLNPCKITKILITHKHGDHVYGLPGLLSTLNFSGYNKNLILYGPKGIKKFLNNFLDIKNFKKDFKFEIKEVAGNFFENEDFYIESEKMTHSVPCNAYSFVLKDKLRIDKKKLEKAKIPAGPLLQDLKKGKNISFNGKKYNTKNLTYLEKGKKISFVLDTSLNNKIVPFVKNSNLFVSECSFDKQRKDLAKEFFHLTSEQVGNIAKKANVEKLIITHLSSRYDKEPKKILSEVKEIFPKVVLANDLDKVEIQ